MDHVILQGDDAARSPMADIPSFIEQQLPVSLLSKESYRERMAGARPDLDPARQLLEGTEAACSGARSYCSACSCLRHG